MEHPLTPILSSVSNNLNELMSRLVNSALPSAVRRKSFILNDIPENLYVSDNENMLAAVLSSLLNTVVNHTENSCIRVSAKPYGGITLVYIKDSGSLSNHTIVHQLKDLQLLVKKVGGCISIFTKRQETPSIAFSFPNMAKAA